MQPRGRFGALDVDGKRVARLPTRSRDGDGSWINGGFFVFSPRIGDYIDGDDTVWEQEPLRRLAPRASCRPTSTTASGSRWTRSARRPELEELWQTGRAPWKVVVVSFWRGRRVLLTGHTGFKGGWLALQLRSSAPR